MRPSVAIVTGNGTAGRLDRRADPGLARRQPMTRSREPHAPMPPAPREPPRSPASASWPWSSTAPVRSARCTSPTWARRSSRSRTPAPAATSAATSRRDGPDRTACSSRPSTGASESSPRPQDRPAGRDVFERLVASADAVFSNLRGDQPERLGLTYDVLRADQPRDRVRRADRLRRVGPTSARWPATTR